MANPTPNPGEPPRLEATWVEDATRLKHTNDKIATLIGSEDFRVSTTLDALTESALLQDIATVGSVFLDFNADDWATLPTRLICAERIEGSLIVNAPFSVTAGKTYDYMVRWTNESGLNPPGFVMQEVYLRDPDSKSVVQFYSRMGTTWTETIMLGWSEYLTTDILTINPEGIMATSDVAFVSGAADTWEELDVAFEYSSDMWLMEAGATGRLKLNDALESIRFRPESYDLTVNMTVSSSCPTQSRSWDFTIFHNGAELSGIVDLLQMGLDTDKSQTIDIRGTVALPAITLKEITNGDEISVGIKVSNSGTTIDIHNVILSVQGTPHLELGNLAAPWLPLDFPGVTSWMSENSPFETSGSDVTKWASLSPGTRDLTTGNASPELVVLDNSYGVSFEAASLENLAYGLLLSDLFTAGAGMIAFVVELNGLPAAANPTLYYSSDCVMGSMNAFMHIGAANDGAGNVLWSAGIWATGEKKFLVSGAAPGTKQVLLFWWDGSLLHLMIDGVEETPVGAGSIGDMNSLVQVGKAYTTGPYLNAVLQEVVTANQVGDASDRTALDNYLRTKWNVGGA